MENLPAKIKASPPEWFLLIAIAALAALAYAPGITSPFVLDDAGTVVGNMSLRGFPSLHALVPPRGSSVAGRPFANLSFAVSFALGGLRPAGFRIMNLAIHILAAWFLFLITKTALGDPKPFPKLRPHAGTVAFFSALIFALHPLQTGAVTYITQRAESLSAMLGLGALWFAARGFSSSYRNSWHAASVLFLFLAAGSKETAAAMPVIIYFYDTVICGSGWRQALSRSRLLYLGAATALLFLVALTATGRQAETVHSSYSWWSYLLAQPGTIGTYLRLCLSPTDLCFDRWNEAAGRTENLAWGLVLATALAFTLAGLWKRKPAAFGAAWFFLALAPSSSFYPLADAAAEYRVYPALAPLAVLFCSGIFLLGMRLPPRGGNKAAAAFLCVCCIALGVACWSRNAVFASAEDLWADTLARCPDNPRAMVNLGRALADKGDFAGATELFRRALGEAPDLSPVHANLGYALLRTGRAQEAADELTLSLALSPDNPGTLALLGEALHALGRDREAMVRLDRALELFPELSDARRLRNELEKAGSGK
ncbi:MAG: tetratricopeptide repeat protein [Thermodesulfobacteriota bacterium]